jgi:hypothetical protein
MLAPNRTTQPNPHSTRPPTREISVPLLTNRDSRLGLLPVRRLRDRVLQVRRDGRPVALRGARLGVVDHDSRVVQVVWADLVVDGEEAAGHAVEVDAIVVGAADVAVGCLAFAVRHQGCCVLEESHAHGTLHARHAVAVHDVLVEVGGDGEGLSGAC